MSLLRSKGTLILIGETALAVKPDNPRWIPRIPGLETPGIWSEIDKYKASCLKWLKQLQCHHLYCVPLCTPWGSEAGSWQSKVWEPAQILTQCNSASPKLKSEL